MQEATFTSHNQLPGVVATSTSPSDLLSVGEAAHLLGVHVNTLRAWTERGVLECLRINGRGDRRYRRAELERFLAAAAAEGTAGSHAETAGDAGDCPECVKLRARLSDFEERARRAELVMAAGRDMTGRLDPDEVLAELVERTADVFGAQHGVVLARLPEGGVRVRAAHQLSAEYRECLEHTTRLPLIARAFDERRVVSVVDFPDDPAAHELRPALLREGINTATIAPLISHGEGVGVLALYHDERHEWTPEDLHLLERLAGQGAMIVRNAQDYSRMATWAAQLQSIQQLGTRLTRLRSVVEIGQTICSELNQLIECHNIRVYRVIGEDCVPVAWRGETGEYEGEEGEQLRTKVGQGITGWVARYGLAQNLGDAAGDRRTQTIPGTQDDLDESLLLAPMLYEDEVIGVIVLAKLGLNQFTSDDLRLLEIYASIAAQAMANADTTERLRAQSQTLEHQLHSQRELLRVTESLLGTLDTQALLDQIADSLSALLDFDNICVDVHDHEQHVLRPIFARGVHAKQYLAAVLPDDQGEGGHVIRTGEALLIDDELSDSRVAHFTGTGPMAGALIVAPLRSGEGIQGVLTVERLGEGAAFSEEEFDLVKLFAAHVSIALRNAEAHRAVELRAETDPLTGLWNHGALTQQIERLVGQGARFSMLMVDLDFFKRYNDSFGHQGGNTMLQRVAEVLRSSCRESDLVFRFGGDEFALLLPSTGLVGARTVAEKIRRAISRLNQPNAPVSVTCSVGIGVYPKDGSDAVGIITAADRACYAGKRGGRDRIATAAEGLALAADFRPTEPARIEISGPAVPAA